MTEEKMVYPVRLDPDTYQKLRTFAEREDLSAAQVIRRAIRKELKAIEADEKGKAG